MLDHLVIGCADLGLGSGELERLAGVEPVSGGRHPAWGTANALLGIDDATYLELLGPADRRRRSGKRLSRLRGLSLVWWCVPLNSAARRLDLTPIAGSRRTPEGAELSWTLFEPPAGHPLLPFFIDWSDTPHPAATLEPRVALRSFVLRTSSPGALLDDLNTLGIHGAVVERSGRDGYVALFEGRHGLFRIEGEPIGLRWS